MTGIDTRLSRALLAEGLVPEQQLETAVEMADRYGRPLDTILLELSLLGESIVADVLSRAWDSAPVGRQALSAPQSDAVSRLSRSLATSLGICPLWYADGALHVAVSSGLNDGVLVDIGVLLQCDLVPHVVPEVHLHQALHAAYDVPIPERLRGLSGRTGAAEAPAAATPGPGDLTQATTRDEFCRMAVRFARQHLPYAAMIGLHRGQAIGWFRSGPADNPRFEGAPLVVPPGSILHEISLLPAPFVGRPPVSDANLEVFSWLGRRRPRTAILLPVAFGPRAIAVLYADSGIRSRDAADLVDLVAFGNGLAPALAGIVKGKAPPSLSPADVPIPPALEDLPDIDSSLELPFFDGISAFLGLSQPAEPATVAPAPPVEMREDTDPERDVTLPTAEDADETANWRPPEFASARGDVRPLPTPYSDEEVWRVSHGPTTLPDDVASFEDDDTPVSLAAQLDAPIPSEDEIDSFVDDRPKLREDLDQIDQSHWATTQPERPALRSFRNVDEATDAMDGLADAGLASESDNIAVSRFTHPDAEAFEYLQTPVGDLGGVRLVDPPISEEGTAEVPAPPALESDLPEPPAMMPAADGARDVAASEDGLGMPDPATSVSNLPMPPITAEELEPADANVDIAAPPSDLQPMAPLPEDGDNKIAGPPPPLETLPDLPAENDGESAAPALSLGSLPPLPTEPQGESEKPVDVRATTQIIDVPDSDSDSDGDETVGGRSTRTSDLEGALSAAVSDVLESDEGEALLHSGGDEVIEDEDDLGDAESIAAPVDQENSSAREATGGDGLASTAPAPKPPVAYVIDAGEEVLEDAVTLDAMVITALGIPASAEQDDTEQALPEGEEETGELILPSSAEQDVDTWKQTLETTIVEGKQAGVRWWEDRPILAGDDDDDDWDEVTFDPASVEMGGADDVPAPIDDDEIDVDTDVTGLIVPPLPAPPEEDDEDVTEFLPPLSLTAGEVDELLADLESDRFEIRDAAIRKLERGDDGVISILQERFPGRMRCDPFADQPGKAVELSALVALLARMGPRGLDVAASHLDASYPAHRFAAVFLYILTPATRAIDELKHRLNDTEPAIRDLATMALSELVDHPAFESTILRNLRSRLDGTNQSRKTRAIQLLGAFRDVVSIPVLIRLLDSPGKPVAEAASSALEQISLQSFGRKRKAWEKWWEQAKNSTRIDWLLDGLSARDRNVRMVSSIELLKIAGDTFGYHYDAPKPQRLEASERYRAWWLDVQSN